MRKFISVKSITLLSCALFLLIWAFWPPFVRFYSGQSDQSLLGQFGDMYGPVNALFSAITLIGLIYTISAQRIEQLRDEKARAIVDLYERHTTEYHYQITHCAWRVLKNCVLSKEYFEFVVRTFFATEYYGPSLLQNDLIDFLASRYQRNPPLEIEELIKIESDDRHRLVDVMNFFNIVSLRDVPNDIFRRCEFYYDWWRPLLWKLSDALDSKYESLAQNRSLVIKPNWSEMLKDLDRKYGFKSQDNPEAREYEYRSHPLIKAWTEEV